MKTALLASKQLNALRPLKNQNPINPFPRLRHLSSETEPPSPPPLPPSENDPSVVTLLVKLLQSPENEWNSEELRHLIFPNIESTSLSPSNVLQITRRLGSSSKALKFLEWVRVNSPPQLQISNFQSFTFQAIFELASREPSSENKLLELLGMSKDLNVPLTINSATLLARCFARVKLVDKSLLVYESLNQNLRNSHVRNVLIDVLLRSDRVSDALNMLDEMLEPNVEFSPNESTADIVFGGLLRRDGSGRLVNEEKLIGLVMKFGKLGLFPNSIRLTQLISTLCRSGKTNRASDVLEEVMKLGGSVEVASCNALLTGFGREGNFEKLNALLAEMKKRDVQPNIVTFGILINNLCKFRNVDEALEVFERMKSGESDGVLIEPDVVTYNTLIDGLCKVGRQEEGLGLMEQMRSQRGCTPNTVTYNCLIDGFCKAGEVDRSIELFDQMNEEGVPPNVITLNTLINGMCRHGRISSAMDYLRKVQGKGLKGNAVTYTALINAFCNANNIDKAMDLFNEMTKSGCSPDAIVYYTLISGLSQAGRMDDASFVASKAKEAGFGLDIACYNILISGFCKKNKVDKVYLMLKDIEGAGLKPDTVTYNTLISYLSKKGDFQTAHKVLKKMTSEGLVPTVFTYGALIHAYCINGNLDEAIKIFREMISVSRVPPNTVIYNILINSFCKNNDVENALSLMDDMKTKGVRANANTYNAMFKGLQEKNWQEKAFELMDRMTEEACNPDYVTMEILTQWLSAVGETNKLRSFVQGYKVCASAG